MHREGTNALGILGFLLNRRCGKDFNNLLEVSEMIWGSRSD